VGVFIPLIPDNCRLGALYFHCSQGVNIALSVIFQKLIFPHLKSTWALSPSR
jgi:hypothetical protein